MFQFHKRCPVCTSEIKNHFIKKEKEINEDFKIKFECSNEICKKELTLLEIMSNNSCRVLDEI